MKPPMQMRGQKLRHILLLQRSHCLNSVQKRTSQRNLSSNDETAIMALQASFTFSLVDIGREDGESSDEIGVVYALFRVRCELADEDVDGEGSVESVFASADVGEVFAVGGARGFGIDDDLCKGDF